MICFPRLLRGSFSGPKDYFAQTQHDQLDTFTTLPLPNLECSLADQFPSCSFKARIGELGHSAGQQSQPDDLPRSAACICSRRSSKRIQGMLLPKMVESKQEQSKRITFESIQNYSNAINSQNKTSAMCQTFLNLEEPIWMSADCNLALPGLPFEAIPGYGTCKASQATYNMDLTSKMQHASSVLVSARQSNE